VPGARFGLALSAHRRRPPRGLANRRAAVLSPDAACFGVQKHAPPPRARRAIRALLGTSREGHGLLHRGSSPRPGRRGHGIPAGEPV